MQWSVDLCVIKAEADAMGLQGANVAHQVGLTLQADQLVPVLAHGSDTSRNILQSWISAGWRDNAEASSELLQNLAVKLPAAMKITIQLLH